MKYFWVYKKTAKHWMITRAMSRRLQQQEDKRPRARIPSGIVAMRRGMKAEKALEEKKAAIEVAERQARKEAAEKEKQARKAQKAALAAEKKAQKEAQKEAQKAERADSKAREGFYSFWNRALDTKIRDHDEIARMKEAAETLLELSGVEI